MRLARTLRDARPVAFGAVTAFWWFVP